MHEKGRKKLDRNLWLVPKKKKHSEETSAFTKWSSSHPFWQISLNIMGPPPASQGNKFNLLIGDQISKWYEAVALPNQAAKTVSRAFV